MEVMRQIAVAREVAALADLKGAAPEEGWTALNYLVEEAKFLGVFSEWYTKERRYGPQPARTDFLVVSKSLGKMLRGVGAK